ncbi:MAG TPA: 4-hydroxythreonine-4-phosphate dehydrogenase PdxA [Negativicutes bacterium]|nr:4-hydroxythreonine-4-phosphate dehydrogenase PdxA [Negativicutes bacterium]
MIPILGITLGEAAGIGPEIVAKLCAQKRLAPYCRPVLIGDARVLELGKKIAGVDFPVAIVQKVADIDWDGPIPLLDQKNFDPANLEMGKINVESGKATGDTLVAALRLLQQGDIAGMVFAPLNKQAFILGGYDYEDEHALFRDFFNWDKPAGIMNVLDKLWTFRVTCHIPISDVAASLNKGNVLSAIQLADQTLRLAGYDYPRIGVAALNPHAGEGGLCGREEVDIILPAIEAARAIGINALGPFSADTIFIAAFKGAYDAVLTMYHDQGQIATKLIGFDIGVTVAAGLPYPITTPEHGTAFDIAGKGVAKVEATEQAVILAAKLAGWRPK